MDKKALVLYWIVPLVIGALILFVVLVAQTTQLQTTVQGTWAFSFLDVVHAAEKNLLMQDQYVKYAGWQTALQLAEQGGFTTDSPCGQIDNVNVWNKQEEWDSCLPDIRAGVNLLVKEKLAEKDKAYFIDFSGNNLWGASRQKGEIISNKDYYQKYTYGYNFSIDLGYSFDEHDSMKHEAQFLVHQCRNVKDLQSCLERQKPENWKFTSCDEERYRLGHVKIPFCVESTSVYDEQFQLQRVKYNFALDFTPTTPFSIENIDGRSHPQPNTYIISFDISPIDVEKYTVYFIDTTYGRELITKSTFNWDTVPSTVVHDNVDFSFNQLEQACPTDVTLTTPGEGYICQEKIHLVVNHEDLKDDQSFFIMVSSTKDGKESQYNTEIIQISVGAP